MRTLHLGSQRAVAVVNAVQRIGDDPGARLADVLRSFGEEDVTLTDADVAAIVAVCGRLREVLAAADRDAAAAALDALLAATAGPPRLVRHGSWDWHLHVDRDDDAPWAEWLASSAALALAALLVEAAGVPWGVCAADGCGTAFLHDGRGGARRWCSTTCATRERVRRHRRSQAAAGGGRLSRRTPRAPAARRGASATA